MNNRVVFLILYFIFGLSLTNNAQEVNSNDFVGVWTPAEKTWVNKIKISYSDGKYTVQLKTEDGIKTCKDVSCNNNVLTWSYFDETEYGSWTIRYNATVGRTGFEIIDIYGTTVGRTTENKIFNKDKLSRHVRATYHNDYMNFEATLKEGNLNVRCGYSMKYYSSSNDLLFMSGPHYYDSWTFTNW